jgi:tripartite-type tricarboxylate transporter receptor subunit TctC
MQRVSPAVQRVSPAVQLIAAILILAWSGAVLAQAPAAPYPVKPVRVIVGFPPGSGADITARVIGQKLGEAYGQQFVVDNRPGAGSNIAADLAAKAAPDGYTVFIGTVANTINATLYAKLPFDFARDFAPVALTTSAANVLVVHPSVAAQSVAELISLAKARPGQLNYGSAGTGTAPHLSAELFQSMAGIRLVHIPYKGSPLAVTDLIGGQIALMFSPASSVLAQIKSGRLRALAVTTAVRLPSLPELPTVAESGLPGFETVTWFGFVVPAATARDIVGKLNSEIVKVLAQPEIRRQFAAQGIDVIGGTPEQFAAYIRAEIAKWARVIKESGARAE